MKKLFILLFTFLTLSLYSQDKISIGLFQDGKLLVSDDTHGNTAPTIDLMLSFDLEGSQFKTYYFSVRPQIEFTNLDSGNLYRYAVIPMWNFNRWNNKGIEFSIGTGIGMIHKNNGSSLSYSFVSELTYPITDRWSVGARNEWVRRTELITPVLRYNLSFGIKYDITI